MDRRSTIQKKIIRETVLGMDTHPTADEVYAQVCQQWPGISKGTVYRNLNLLAEEGGVLRVPVANGADRYDRTLGEHCHLYCLGCGRVYDYSLDRPVLPQPERNPGFQAVSCSVLFSGYCPDCQPPQEEKITDKE